jgi:hypothetical protein
MNVQVWHDEPLKVYNLPIAEIAAFISLVKDYGFQDMEGTSYLFDSAQVDADGTVTIYVQPTEESIQLKGIYILDAPGGEK